MATAWLAATGGAGAVHGQTAETAMQSEFGTVIAQTGSAVDLQVYVPKAAAVERHRYLRTRDTRADAVHAGDQVQVLFVMNGSARILRRLAIVPTRLERQPLGNGPAPAAGTSAVPVPDLARHGSVAAANAPGGPAAKASLPAAGSKAAGKAQAAPVRLGGSGDAKVAPAIAVPLGLDAGYSAVAAAPKARSVTVEAPSAACRASDADWASQPLRMAVLDFRYPTAREQAHDAGTAGGGSGMAVADMVYERLKTLPEFAVDRGDRERLDRADIAGAARLGRELGADAVLEGTFFPVEEKNGDDATRVAGYELHAGVVDTCTGQVLMKLNSVVCPAGVKSGPACKHLAVSTKDAEDPAAHLAQFAPAVDALLYPLEHNGGDLSAPTDAPGRVIGVFQGAVTVQFSPGFRVRPGDELSLHAARLAKNPTTYTLMFEKDEEIGRLTVKSLDGSRATCGYQGDLVPKVGDTVWVPTP